ncbi:MAG: NfeD family protein [Firmicutes bacterium]|nr:NfeD family protein [Bacillota bacterium]
MSWLWWIAIAIVLVIAEVFSLTFYLILLALGALAAAAAQAIGLSLNWQLAIFVVVSLVLTGYLQPILKRSFIEHQGRPSNIDAIIGLKGYVTETVTDEHGLVKIDKEVWSARGLDGQTIEVGTQVEVVRIEGVKLMVRKA